MLKWITGLVLLGAFLVGPAWSQTAPTDKLIVPGVRIGPISLGMTGAQLYRVMGDPAYSSVYTGGQRYGYGKAYSPLGDLAAWFAPRSSGINEVTVVDPSYSTAEGLHVGASVLASRSLLGAPEQSFNEPAPPGWSIIKDCYARGILVYMQNGVINSITVMPAGVRCLG